MWGYGYFNAELGKYIYYEGNIMNAAQVLESRSFINGGGGAGAGGGDSFISMFFENGGSAIGLLTMIQQLKNAGEEDPVRKYLKNKSTFNNWGIETTEIQYQLDHINTILELKQVINKTEEFTDKVDSVMDWTPAITGIKGVYDFIKEGAKSLNPATLIFTLGATTISIENSQAKNFLEMYRNVQSNYIDLHSKNPSRMKGITVNIEMIKGPQNHIWSNYSFYDISTHRYLGEKHLNRKIIMLLKATVLILTIMIFFIRIFSKESANIFNDNFNYLFGITIDKIVIYVYQLSVMLLITSVKKINFILVIILLLLNIFLITCYLYQFR